MRSIWHCHHEQLLADFSPQKKHNASGGSEHVGVFIVSLVYPIQIYSSWNVFFSRILLSPCFQIYVSTTCPLSRFPITLLSELKLAQGEIKMIVSFFYFIYLKYIIIRTTSTTTPLNLGAALSSWAVPERISGGTRTHLGLVDPSSSGSAGENQDVSSRLAGRKQHTGRFGRRWSTGRHRIPQHGR